MHFNQNSKLYSMSLLSSRISEGYVYVRGMFACGGGVESSIPRGSLLLSKTQVLGHSVPSSEFQEIRHTRMWCTCIHADKTCIHLKKTVVYRKVSYCFIHIGPQAALEMRCGNDSKSVPAEEHLNTDQPLCSASLVQFPDVTV